MFGAGQREFAVDDEIADAVDQINFSLGKFAMPGVSTGGLQQFKLGFPIPQDVGFGSRHFAGLADGVKIFIRD